MFGNTRTIRVLLPPGYDDPKSTPTRYPVMYFTDGVAVFAPPGRNLPAVAEELWEANALPRLILIGVDNGACTRESTNPLADRASEYLPYQDQSWDEPRPEARGGRFPAFLIDEVMPEVARRYRVATGAGSTGLGGSSYGAIAALHAVLQRPGVFGRVLIESPSLHIGSGAMLRDAADARAWPARIALGVGTAEGDTPDTRLNMVDDCLRLRDTIRADPRVSLQVTIEPGAEHGEPAWRGRLPGALSWLWAE